MSVKARARGPVILALAFVACSSGPATVNIRVQVRANESAQAREATLTCDPPAGTEWLSDTTKAGAACTQVRSRANTKRLIDGSPSDRACTEIYGGPQIARVTGTIGGKSVDATISRSDGCGIADWQALGSLLGPPP